MNLGLEALNVNAANEECCIPSPLSFSSIDTLEAFAASPPRPKSFFDEEGECILSSRCSLTLENEEAMQAHLMSVHNMQHHHMEVDENGVGIVQMDTDVHVREGPPRRSGVLVHFDGAVFCWTVESRRRADTETQASVAIQLLQLPPPGSGSSNSKNLGGEKNGEENDAPLLLPPSSPPAVATTTTTIAGEEVSCQYHSSSSSGSSNAETVLMRRGSSGNGIGLDALQQQQQSLLFAARATVATASGVAIPTSSTSHEQQHQHQHYHVSNNLVQASGWGNGFSTEQTTTTAAAAAATSPTEEAFRFEAWSDDLSARSRSGSHCEYSPRSRSGSFSFGDRMGGMRGGGAAGGIEEIVPQRSRSNSFTSSSNNNNNNNNNMHPSSSFPSFSSSRMQRMQQYYQQQYLNLQYQLRGESLPRYRVTISVDRHRPDLDETETTLLWEGILEYSRPVRHERLVSRGQSLVVLWPTHRDVFTPSADKDIMQMTVDTRIEKLPF